MARFLSMKQASAQLGGVPSSETLYRLARLGILPVKRIGRRIVISQTPARPLGRHAVERRLTPPRNEEGADPLSGRRLHNPSPERNCMKDSTKPTHVSRHLKDLLLEMCSADQLLHLAAIAREREPYLVARGLLSPLGAEKLAEILTSGSSPTVGFIRRYRQETAA
jgi:hypothetical protein